MLSGSIPALITPFRDGSFDEEAFRRFVDWQIESGSAALVPCGTTGESPTLSHEEHMRVVEVCVEQAAGRVPVVAGAGSNATSEAIQLARHAKDAGADAVLVVSPYYNKPSQEGLFRHFEAIHEAAEIPIVLYNIPGRSIVDIGLETMVRLAALPRVIGVKDATDDISRVADYLEAIGEDFCQLSGTDETALAHRVHGGKGCISVTANVAPKLCADFQKALDAGDLAAAQAINAKLHPLHRAMFCAPSPAPCKYALSRVHDWLTTEVRQPILACDDGTCAQIDAALAHAGLV